jgi:hypothetical protein
MLERFGEVVMTRPKGMLRPIHFTSLLSMDKRTGDGRKLLSEGRGVRELPRTIYAQFTNSPGHDNAVVAGRPRGRNRRGMGLGPRR